MKNVGGQAVLEGVMMRGEKGVAIAVRKQDGNIEVKVDNIKPLSKKNKFFSLPIIRGFVSMIDSFMLGSDCINYSAKFYEDDDGNTDDGGFMSVLVVIISIILSVGLFFLLPTFIVGFINRAFKLGTFFNNVLEGLVRVFLFATYLFLISRVKDIKRFFQYHGAEHKTIFCYENDEELTIQNVSEFSRFHPRCGTNFLFLVMVVSILLFTMVGWTSLWQRFLYRILLIPVVTGVTYELIRWLSKSQNIFSKIIVWPGLQFQKLTTIEPDKDQMEVAIVALKACEGLDYDLSEYNNSSKHD